MAIYTGAKALSRWPINDESTLTGTWKLIDHEKRHLCNRRDFVTCTTFPYGSCLAGAKDLQYTNPTGNPGTRTGGREGLIIGKRDCHFVEGSH
jgi:hypothetical protein